MLNKRAATLLALFLAGSMVLSGPSSALASASAGDSEETSQTETKENEDTDSVKKKKSKAKKEKAENTENEVSDTSTPAPDDEITPDPSTETSEEEEGESAARTDVSGNTDTPPVSGEVQEGDDYTYVDGVLTILTDKKMTVSGTLSGNIVVSSNEGADLTFNDLHITEDPALCIESGSGLVEIRLTGKNVLSNVQIENSAGVKLYGPGIFSANGSIKGSAVISGGNIQAPFADPENGEGVPLYAVSVNGLEVNRSYKITDMKAGTPQRVYSYGNEILADEDGGLVMYLPAGEAQITLDGVTYEGNVVSGNGSELKVPATPTPTVTNTPTAPPDTETPRPTTTPITETPRPRPSTTPTDVPDQQAKAADNGLYWINEGATYRSGATLQFYATGDGYGPEEPQYMDPVRNATRYVPVEWNVGTSSGVAGTSGSWTKKNREETVGSTSGNTYTPGEFRFKSSFIVSTNQAAAVPCTLRVNYQREVYNGKRWRADGTTATKSVSFYIRNVSITATPTRYSSTYTRSGVTTTASRSSVSSNARNASTMDNTPIGALLLLMTAAAGSGVVIFRKKRKRL